MKVDSKVLLCKDTLKCETMDDFYHCSCYDVKCDECPLSEFCNSESLEFIKLKARKRSTKRYVNAIISWFFSFFSFFSFLGFAGRCVWG
mgnify:CR=1 FL=1